VGALLLDVRRLSDRIGQKRLFIISVIGFTIAYYLKKRHIFGDMKLEVLDSTKRIVGTLPTSKRRGLSRITWGMRLPAPTVPAAASVAGGATVGPRVLPGTYTVRMTKDDKVYSTPLVVLPDPRATHTAAERKGGDAMQRPVHRIDGDADPAGDDADANRTGEVLSDMTMAADTASQPSRWVPSRLMAQCLRPSPRRASDRRRFSRHARDRFVRVIGRCPMASMQSCASWTGNYWQVRTSRCIPPSCSDAFEWLKG